MDHQKIIDKFVKEKLISKKVPFYSCGFLFCSNKKIKPKIEVVVKSPQRFNKIILKKIPKIFNGFKVKIV